MLAFEPFQPQPTLDPETFRKNGPGVTTPFWLVMDGGTLSEWAGGASGKVKRARNHPLVHITLCNMGWALLGDWIEAPARLVSQPDIDRKADRLPGKKIA